MDWIKVTDQLPEHGVKVLTFIEDDPIVEILYYHKVAGLWKDPNSPYKTKDVTYWQPLPKLPKGYNILEALEDFKIHITPEQSMVVQATLFSFGIPWASGETTIHNLQSNYLFIRNKLISHWQDAEYFNGQDLPQLTFEQFKNLYIKPMETKTLSIQIPEGFEIDKENSTFEKIVFKELPKKPKRVTKWNDFKCIQGGYYIERDSAINENTVGSSSIYNDRNIWPTKELAEASLALCQLIRYRDNWNEGWIADWKTHTQNKYCVTLRLGKAGIELWNNNHKILSFERSIIANEFLETFKDLIEIAKPLL